PNHPIDHVQELLVDLSPSPRADSIRDTAFQIVARHDLARGAKGLLRGSHLLENFAARTVGFEHSVDSFDLPTNSVQAPPNFGLSFGGNESLLGYQYREQISVPLVFHGPDTILPKSILQGFWSARRDARLGCASARDGWV